MAYPLRFHRLVIGGTFYTETWNTSLSIQTPTDVAVSSALLTTIAAAVSGWWTGVGATGLQVPSTVKLAYIKLNRIDVDGHYADEVSMTHIYPTPVNGGSAAVDYPPQLAAVVSLRTAFDRGLASKGRMYIPSPLGFITPGADGRASASSAARVASSVAGLINNINAAYTSIGGGDFTGRVAVFSSTREGAWHAVTRTQAGRVVDTMRSRRSSLAEDPQVSTVAIAGA